MQSLQLCVVKYVEWQDRREEQEEEPLTPPEAIEESRKVLCSVVERMLKAELEDFELDKSSDFTSGSGVARKNRLQAILLMSIYEVQGSIKW